METLQEAKEWLRERAENGAECPCCTQFAKVYRRRMTAASARTMIGMWRLEGRAWTHVPTLLRRSLPDINQGGYSTLGQFWGLIQESTERHEEGSGGRAGWWRITEKGERYVRNDLLVPSHVRLYDGRVLGHDGEMVCIMDTLGTKFNYQELMQGI